MSFELGEVDRMISGMLMPGVVAAVDPAAARVRIESDGWTSAWLPWFAGAAGAARHWRVPSIGEQALLASPSGDPAQGFALVGFYTDAHGHDGRASVVAWRMPDGCKIEYDHAAGAMLVDGCQTIAVRNAATINIESGGAVTVKAPSIKLDTPAAEVTGNLTIGGALSQGGGGGGNASFGGSVEANGDVTAGGISLQGHTHTEQGDGADVSTPK